MDEREAILRLETRFLPDGAYTFEGELEIEAATAITIITCTAWLLELYQLEAGDLFFARGEERVRPSTKSLGVFYPPFTISQPCFENVKGRVTGIASADPPPAETSAVPVVFETRVTAMPGSWREALDIVRAGRNQQSIHLNPKASSLSLRAKRMIDEDYLDAPSIGRIAARLRISPEHLSRQFKRDFRMSPRAYLHQLRLADVPLRLVKGEEIIRVSNDVGYNDLSRFYKQFRKRTKTSPGACRAMLKPNRS